MYYYRNGFKYISQSAQINWSYSQSNQGSSTTFKCTSWDIEMDLQKYICVMLMDGEQCTIVRTLTFTCEISSKSFKTNAQIHKYIGTHTCVSQRLMMFNDRNTHMLSNMFPLNLAHSSSTYWIQHLTFETLDRTFHFVSNHFKCNALCVKVYDALRIYFPFTPNRLSTLTHNTTRQHVAPTEI